MAAEIIKTFIEHLPDVRFIGKRYIDKERINGGFVHYWNEWFKKGWFDKLQELPQIENVESGFIGLSGCSNDFYMDSFEYWIGMMLPSNTSVPEGYLYIDIPNGDVAVCWIYGNAENRELYGKQTDHLCMAKLRETGLIENAHIRSNFKGVDNEWFWTFERYSSRIIKTIDNGNLVLNKDANGKVILDFGIYIEKI
jgi:predicted transcriptional regulator YdeE